MLPYSFPNNIQLVTPKLFLVLYSEDGSFTHREYKGLRVANNVNELYDMVPKDIHNQYSFAHIKDIDGYDIEILTEPREDQNLIALYILTLIDRQTDFPSLTYVNLRVAFFEEVDTDPNFWLTEVAGRNPQELGVAAARIDKIPLEFSENSKDIKRYAYVYLRKTILPPVPIST